MPRQAARQRRSALTLFGEKVTPNIHALAREYVLLDNTYCNGDVSGNGHPWSTGAYGTDVGERAWMQEYGGHAAWALKDKDLMPPAGRIWDVVERKGLTFASYYYTWTTPNTHRNMPKTWEDNLNKLRDFENADLFAADLHRHEREQRSAELHDHGSARGPHGGHDAPAPLRRRPASPQTIWAWAKSWRPARTANTGKRWRSSSSRTTRRTAPTMSRRIAQRRWSSRPTHGGISGVDSTFYTTTSLLRSMELILGLPPMSQYDAAATPMYNAFTNKPDLTPYTARPAQADVMAKNARLAYGAKESQRMDFSGPDRLTAVQVDSSTVSSGTA